MVASSGLGDADSRDRAARAWGAVRGLRPAALAAQRLLFFPGKLHRERAHIEAPRVPEFSVARDQSLDAKFSAIAQLTADRVAVAVECPERF